MLYVVIIYFCLSIILYLLLGGADFGAGIVELFSKPKIRQRTRLITYRTIGPIWEANHMWVIIAIVILFVGFPAIYSTLSTHLHIPLFLLLVGIIGRGTAFIFRHYDAVKDDMQYIYNGIFMYSSLLTPFFLGTVAGGMMSGYINPDAQTFYDAFLKPWTNIFSISVGVFTTSICAFLAAVYLTGETKETLSRKAFYRKAIIFNVTTVIAGGFVFLAAAIENLDLMSKLIADPVTMSALLLATVSLIILWSSLTKGKANLSRLIAGFQVVMILFAVTYHYFPDLVVIEGEPDLSFFNAAAPQSSILALGWALLIGSILILPSLYYLMFSFQKRKPEVSD